MANPTPVTIPSRVATGAGAAVAFAFTAATGSAQTIPWMPGDILLVQNASADTARTFTVVSNPKNSRASETIGPITVAFGTFRVAKRFSPQDADTLQITGSTSDIKFAVLSTRAQPS